MSLPDLGALCSSLADKHRIGREAAVRSLQALLQNVDKAAARATGHPAVEEMIARLMRDVDSWQARHGGLIAMTAYLTWLGDSSLQRQDFFDALVTDLLHLLEDSEFRVRLAAGETLAAVCMCAGLEIFGRRIEEPLLKNIEENLFLDRDSVADQTPEGRNLQKKLQEGAEMNEMRTSKDVVHAHSAHDGADARSTVSSMVSSQSTIYHDTAGWRTLHTYAQCLKAIVEKCKASFSPYLKDHFLEVVFTFPLHCNRFVRANCFDMLVSIIEAAGPMLLSFAEDLVSRLAVGLADDWAEVRMSASIATRTFFEQLPVDQREPFLPSLLPRMCFNRHFSAEGVRMYSQQTWRQIMGESGIPTLERLLDQFINYYIAQARSVNHELRDTACLCIAEVAGRLSQDRVREHVEVLQQALLPLLQDEHWLVCSDACSAQGALFDRFPAEVADHVPAVVTLLFDNLGSKVWSLREAAACALGIAARAEANICTSTILKGLEDGLCAVQQQPSDADSYAPGKGLDDETVRDIKANDPALHTDQQMFCCCSVSATPGAHHDHGKEHHWCRTDGCVYLMRELADQYPEVIERSLSVLAGGCRFRQYVDHIYLLETVWKVLPQIGLKLGKRPFKRHLDAFLDSLFYSLRSTNRLLSTAAAECTKQLHQWVGPQMFRARVEQHNAIYLKELDNVLVS